MEVIDGKPDTSDSRARARTADLLRGGMVLRHRRAGARQRNHGHPVLGRPPASADTLWDLASVTKPIVGLAVMSLVESGRLLLEDTIGQYLPAFADSDKANLTVRHLLTHTSGIPGGPDCTAGAPRRPVAGRHPRTCRWPSPPAPTSVQLPGLHPAGTDRGGGRGRRWTGWSPNG